MRVKDKSFATREASLIQIVMSEGRRNICVIATQTSLARAVSAALV